MRAKAGLRERPIPAGPLQGYHDPSLLPRKYNDGPPSLSHNDFRMLGFTAAAEHAASKQARRTFVPPENPFFSGMTKPRLPW
jgi:hypothetical protein